MSDVEVVLIRVLFFAKARELSGQAESALQVPSRITANELLNTLCANYSLGILRDNLILALNEDYCEEGSTVLELKNGDEVAIIPPISGDISAISDLVAHESCGAISFFVGTTRDNFEDKKVLSLEYEAFEPMALKRLSAICDELRAKWPDIKNIAIYHRLGVVPVKEASVIIAISSPHRETSLQSVQYSIDSLKKCVPIWKKEQYEGDDSTWKENKESASASPSSRKRRHSKLNFDACSVDTTPLAKNLVQINADETEVVRRINCFVDKKREEIDLQNISYFTEKLATDSKHDPEESCARVNSTVFKLKDSNGHLRVRRVNNEVGPQIKPDYSSTLNKLMGRAATLHNSAKIKQETELGHFSIQHGLEERIDSIEKFLGNDPKPAPRNVYERVKNLEDRILHLESISPEYYHFLGEKTASDATKRRKRPTFTVDDLDRYIADIKGNTL